MTQNNTVKDINDEISDLESRLRDAKIRLAAEAPPSYEEASWLHTSNGMCVTTTLSKAAPVWMLTVYISLDQPNEGRETNTSAIHALLLLADSALPLGSFAYSNGLESFLAHNKSLPKSVSPLSSFRRFLKLSVASVASTSLPYILAAHRNPERLETLDNDLDASTPCVVAQRASIAQGRALLGVWERSFRMSYASTAGNAGAAAKSIEAFYDGVKSTIGTADDLGPKGHFPPIWGIVCLAMGVDIRQTAYVFMVNHAKAVLSAAVRASVMGPYQAQNFLASKDLQDVIMERIDREWNTEVEDAGQVVPPLDLWVGRHELLYSRIFNS